MATGYVASSEMKEVFPSAKRVSQVQMSKMMSEMALVRLINSLIDKDGFVITSAYDAAQPFAFNISGYYFEVTTGQSILTAAGVTTSGEIYAHIFVNETASGVAYRELQGTDENSEYTGVLFDTSDTATSQSGEVAYTLHILSVADSVVTIPAESKVKFSSDSVNIDIIDGGLD